MFRLKGIFQIKNVTFVMGRGAYYSGCTYLQGTLTRKRACIESRVLKIKSVPS